MGASKDSNRGDFPERAGEFVANLIDPASPTYSNAKQSAIIGMNVDEMTAHKSAYKLLQQERIYNAVERALEARGCGRDVRSEWLVEIAKSRLTRTTKRYNAEGALVETVISEPTFSDMIKAIDTINRMDGTYNEQKKITDQERDEHRLLIKEIMKDARKRAKDGAEVIIKPDENAVDVEIRVENEESPNSTQES